MTGKCWSNNAHVDVEDGVLFFEMPAPAVTLQPFPAISAISKLHSVQFSLPVQTIMRYMYLRQHTTNLSGLSTALPDSGSTTPISILCYLGDYQQYSM